MKLKNNIYFSTLFAFVLVNSILRYPFEGVAQGGGSDSWDYYSQANQIVTDGQISWFFNILSLYGFYPPYQEVGSALIYSTFSIATGLPVYYSIFFVSLFIGIFSFLISNLFFRIIFKSNYLPLILALFLSCSPDISSSTSWVIHARYTLTIFSFLILFLLLRTFSNDFSFKYFLFLLFSIITIGTIHRSSIWLLAFIILYIMLIFFNNRLYSLNSNLNKKRFIVMNSYIIFSFLVLFISMTGSLLEKSSYFLNWIINLAIDHGIPTIFILGIIPYFYKMKIDTMQISIMLIYLLMFSTFGENIVYNSLDFVYYVYLALGLLYFYNLFGLKLKFNIPVTIFSIILVIAPVFVQVHEVSQPQGYDTRNDFSASYYLKENSNIDSEQFVYDINTTSEKINALTGLKRYNYNLIQDIYISEYNFELDHLLETREGMIVTYGLDRRSTDSEFMKSEIDNPITEKFIQSRNYTYIICNVKVEREDSEYLKYHTFTYSADSKRYTIYSDDNLEIYNI